MVTKRRVGDNILDTNKKIRRIDAAITTSVIVVKVVKGDGTDESPIAAYAQFWTVHGEYIGEMEWQLAFPYH